jgi:large subunit ribosomal protein L10
MTKEQKAQEIQDLTDKLSSVKNLYLTDIAGLDAVQTTALRRACFKANIKLSVIKNTLLAKAMEASDKDFGDLREVLKGNTSLMFSEVGNTPAKLIKTFP